jgi:hypothetical protein
MARIDIKVITILIIIFTSLCFFSQSNDTVSLIDQGLENDPLFQRIDIRDTSLEVSSSSTGNISYILTVFSPAKNYLIRFELIPTSDFTKEFLYLSMINNITNATIVRNGYSISEEIATKGIIIIKNILNYFFNSISKAEPNDFQEISKITTYEKDIFRKNRAQKTRLVISKDGWMIEINDVGSDFTIDSIYCTSINPSINRKKIMVIELVPIYSNLFGEVIKEFFLNHPIQSDLILGMY